MAIPIRKHCSIIGADGYDAYDGHFTATGTDVRSLSVGLAQYDRHTPHSSREISAKVWRHTGSKWSRQSEELPLHRVVDLNATILKSILESGGMPTSRAPHLPLTVVNPALLPRIVDYYRLHRSGLLPRLRDLHALLTHFLHVEPHL